MVGIGTRAIAMPFFAQRFIAMFCRRSTYMYRDTCPGGFGADRRNFSERISPREGFVSRRRVRPRSIGQKQNSDEGLSWWEARASQRFGLWSAHCFSSARASTVRVALGPFAQRPGPIAAGNRAGHHCLSKILMIGRVASGIYSITPSPAGGDVDIRRGAFGIALLRTAVGTGDFLAMFLIGLGMGAEVDIILT